MSYTVYKHTSPSGKVYIGITCQELRARWGFNGRGYKHSPHFMSAIKKYGWKRIEHTTIATGLTQAEAEKLEIELIARYKSYDRRYGYNADLGGSTGAKHTPETRARIGAANRNRVWTEESKRKMREYRLQHPTTPETARKIGDANRGRKHSRETIEKMRAAQKKSPVRNLDTGTVYKSVGEAARATNADPSKIVAVCRGKRKTHGGFRWAYEEVVL